MKFMKKDGKGLLLCLVIAVPCWFLGNMIPVVGGAVFAMLAGMVTACFLKHREPFQNGIAFTAKYILQGAVIFLGFGMNLTVVIQTGKQSLPIIISTISISLITAFVMSKALRIPSNASILIGVGSSICGGSAIAATAPVIRADDDEVAQSISVIFFYNMIAALLFPMLGSLLGFSTETGEAFGIFAGTAVNDTSSVTATASTWDSLYHLGSQTLDKAVTVKLTRTLAIIPITLVLSLWQTRKAKHSGKAIPMKNVFPFFILYFVFASVITTVCVHLGLPSGFFTPFKTLSKFLIVLAMSAVGLNTNIVKLIKTGGKPILLGFCCWCGIISISLGMQRFLSIW